MSHFRFTIYVTNLMRYSLRAYTIEPEDFYYLRCTCGLSLLKSITMRIQTNSPNPLCSTTLVNSWLVYHESASYIHGLYPFQTLIEYPQHGLWVLYRSILPLRHGWPHKFLVLRVITPIRNKKNEPIQKSQQTN